MATRACWAAGAFLGLGAAVAGCATSTQFYNEGQGLPSDRATGTVPDGVNGVCRLPNTMRPIIVDSKLWEHTRPCTPRTPSRFIRIGYNPVAAANETDAVAEQEKIFAELKEGRKEDGGNNTLVRLVRSLHERGARDPLLRDRVSKQTTKDYICDYTYLLNTMAKVRERLEKENKCATRAYDTTAKTEVCLFDTSKEETVWLTSSWSCVTHTSESEGASSCFRMCNYDDYCAKFVACATPDVDLTMCALGVCVPEARAGI